MRISTLQIHRQGVNSILDLQTQLFRTQQQLSTGKRMITPADDPTGSAQLLGLSESAAVTEQYQRNIQHLQSRLELEDSVLASVGDNLQRARELAVQALNDTNSAEDRVAIAREVRQITDQVLAVANSKAEATTSSVIHFIPRMGFLLRGQSARTPSPGLYRRPARGRFEYTRILRHGEPGIQQQNQGKIDSPSSVQSPVSSCRTSALPPAVSSALRRASKTFSSATVRS